MKFKTEKLHQAIWFTGGFLLGLSLISLGHASIPKTSETSPNVVTEMKAPKVTAPDLEQDYSKLSNLEQRYAEDWEQQQRLRAATTGVVQNDLRSARGTTPVKKLKRARQ